MARVDVVMPQMGESIAEGTLSRWLKKPGDEVKRDEALFEISTDKVDAEIPSPSAGVLAEVLVAEGQTVPVQTVVARLETEKGAAVAAPAAAGPAPAEAGAVSGAPSGARVSSATALSSGGPPAGSPGASTPQAPPPSTDGGIGAAGNGLEERLRTRSSPLVRKIAAEHGIDLAALRGSGIAGRVTKRDILQYLESGPPARPAAAPAGLPSSVPVPAAAEHHGPVPQPWPGDVVEPMSKIRRLTADHMTAARRQAAHVTSFFEIDLTRIARIRAKARAEFEAQSGQKLTFLPFIVQAVTQTLKRHPILNASVAGTDIIFRKQYNVGIAVALDWGLIVPVIKQADERNLLGLSRAIADLAARARSKQLKPEEVHGGTFTITNPGVFGAQFGMPIINQPQVAILGVGAIEKRAVVVDDAIAIRPRAYLTLGYDHRLVDGADAGRFLSFLKERLENFDEVWL